MASKPIISRFDVIIICQERAVTNLSMTSITFLADYVTGAHGGHQQGPAVTSRSVSYHLLQDSRQNRHQVRTVRVSAQSVFMLLLPDTIYRFCFVTSHRLRSSSAVIGFLFCDVSIKKEILPIVQSLCQDVDYEVRACMCRQLDPVARGLG